MFILKSGMMFVSLNFWHRQCDYPFIVHLKYATLNSQAFSEFRQVIFEDFLVPNCGTIPSHLPSSSDGIFYLSHIFYRISVRIRWWI